jgi:hypothetical protein
LRTASCSLLLVAIARGSEMINSVSGTGPTIPSDEAEPLKRAVE